MKNSTPSDKCRFSQSVGTFGNLRIVPLSGAVYYQALSDVGWREGSNLSTEWRWADGRLERLPDLAAEHVGLNVDVIVAGAFKPGQEARIVQWIQVEPVESHLARPANVGGFLRWLTDR
jgi:hypothetical protein